MSNHLVANRASAASRYTRIRTDRERISADETRRTLLADQPGDVEAGQVNLGAWALRGHRDERQRCCRGAREPAAPRRCLTCHRYQERSIMQWCDQKIGSNADAGMTPMSPPTQPWTLLC